MKVGDLVNSFFDGTYGYGIILEIERVAWRGPLARYRVRWLNGDERWESPRDISLIGEA